ncbi:MAG: hypothetical protein GWM98_19685 [Nitrospinaceae bacterium]|nr:hypothetical protein [Nitrospinaceae bacterium]NIR56296.1 hypothetical protein [Nitrospinaceae bacterium]NIY16948.1 hypothetical protein [Nitrospinaceae bacterium]
MEPLRTLSVVFQEQAYDESEFSSLVARDLGTRHDTLPLGESELLDGLPQALQAMDQPTVDGINTFFISRLARELGLKVCLSGLGGDEVFGGYESFRLVPQLRRWNRALGPLPRFGRRGAARVLKSFIPHSDKRAKFMEFLGEEKSSPQLYFLIRALFHEEAVGRLFAEPALAPRLASRFHKRKESLASLLDPLGPEEQVSYLELTHYLVQMLLRDTDVMSMAHGLEVRVPLIDHTLVELMFSVSSSHKWRGSTPKPLLVQSVGGGLPARLIHRKKMGFTLPFESWMRGALKNHVEEVLHTPVAPLTGLLSEPAVRQVWQDFLARRTSWSRPWALYVLKHWVQNNLTS